MLILADTSSLKRLSRAGALVIMLGMPVAGLNAQDAPKPEAAAQPGSQAAAADCVDAAPATPPAPGPSSGTAPGNEGSTGWTGGTGGSYTGTTPHADADGASSGKASGQPETVQGLDLKGADGDC